MKTIELCFYDWFLLIGVLYTANGSDLLLNWGAGLITGKRLAPESRNPFERLYYFIHARNDPNMRATAPISGSPDRIPAWNHALAVSNGTIVLILEILIVVGFVSIAGGGTIPDFARLAAFAWLMRSVWGELSYWHILTASEVEPLGGWRLAWYWLIGMPQAFFPFLAAERFYPLEEYTFKLSRLTVFLAVPVLLMILFKILYRKRVRSPV